MGESKREQSLARTGRGFTVGASPFNTVKVDLAIILFVGFVLFLVHEALSSNPLIQLGILSLYGLGSMVFLLSRVRNVSRDVEVDQKCGTVSRFSADD